MSNIIMRVQYVKIENEDLEEKLHQRARFLIYKALQKADSLTTQTSSLSCNKVFYRSKAKFFVRLRKMRFIFVRVPRRACLRVTKQFNYMKGVLKGKKAVV